MRIGTRSILYGAHAYWLHPWFVALAWTRLYGLPRDPRVWVAFFLHDLGYAGKPEMDGAEGESHPEWAARVMSRLFDSHRRYKLPPYIVLEHGGKIHDIGPWGQFVLLHSRFYAKAAQLPYSRLCVADKLSFALTPRWIYLPMVIATGEIYEYMRLAEDRTAAGEARYAAQGQHLGSRTRWWLQVSTYMTKWAEEHADGRTDTWTPDMGHRQAVNETGLWR